MSLPSLPGAYPALILGGLLALLGGCGVPATPHVDEAPLRAFAASGYPQAEQQPVHTTEHAWLLAGRTRPVLLSEPERGNALPLVVYLPGLGEAPAAGLTWRMAWAGAGYAVLSVQPLAEDAGAWQSDLARAGDFHALGQLRYAGPAMARRVHDLAEVLAEARRRTAAGEAGWQRIDWSHVALAGYDLGAYTAMALAGERVRGAGGVAGALDGIATPRAVVALSPYANVSEGGMDTRYQAIHTPVLSVSSEADIDPLGLVSAAALRMSPYEHSPGPDQYLLWLQGLAHARLSGSAGTAVGPAGKHPAARRGGDGSGADDESQRPRGGSGGAGGGNGRHRGGNGGGGEATRSMPRERDQSAGAASGQSDSAVQARLIAAQNVSTAFLDGYLKDDALAREWLERNAPRWLGSGSELRHK